MCIQEMHSGSTSVTLYIYVCDISWSCRLRIADARVVTDGQTDRRTDIEHCQGAGSGEYKPDLQFVPCYSVAESAAMKMHSSMHFNRRASDITWDIWIPKKCLLRPSAELARLAVSLTPLVKWTLPTSPACHPSTNGLSHTQRTFRKIYQPDTPRKKMDSPNSSPSTNGLGHTPRTFRKIYQPDTPRKKWTLPNEYALCKWYANEPTDRIIHATKISHQRRMYSPNTFC